MSNSKKWDETFAQREAAGMLFCEFVKKNPEAIMCAMQRIIPFFKSDCSISDMRGFLNVVNVTFATVALDVIKSSMLEPDDPQRQLLPVNADDMRTAIFHLTRIMDALEPLAKMIERFGNDPSFKMMSEAFSKEECYG